MKNIKVLDQDQEKKFLELVSQEPLSVLNVRPESPILQMDRSDWKVVRNTVIVLLMLDAGLRVGEVIGLRYSDVYFEGKPAKRLTIRAAIAKRKEERVVPLSERLVNALIRYVSDPELLKAWPITQKMVTRYPDGPGVTTRAIEKMTKKKGFEALGYDVHPHMLRHTCATKLMRVTGLRTVQMILGHKNLNSTQIYTHPNSSDLEKAIDKQNNPGPAEASAERPENGGLL